MHFKVIACKEVLNRKQSIYKMQVISLFSGIGGFDIAARWMGWETVAWCEWDKNCQRVLKYHFPNAIPHDDITKTDFTRYAGQIDILTGGFPCQPYSTAGKRLGKDDDRHLWPEMLRAIREVRPRWVVGENVRGLVSWNGGLVFDEVQTDLEAEGYEVLPFILPACAVDAPHRRDRVWFVAYSNKSRHSANAWTGGKPDKVPGINRPEIGTRLSYGATTQNAYKIRRDSNKSESDPGERQQWQFGSGNDVRVSDVTNAKENRGRVLRSGDKEADAINGVFSGDGSTPNAEQVGRENGIYGGKSRWEAGEPRNGFKEQYWQQFPTQPPVCGGNDGISRRLDGITFPKWREFSIGAYGNAIVPQVAYQIFKAIQETENQLNTYCFSAKMAVLDEKNNIRYN